MNLSLTNNTMYTFDDIRNNGLLLFECKRGSHAFGLATDKSDIDTGGVYIAEPDVLFGIRNLENTRTNYQPQISSEKNDDVWYELGTFMELLSKSNPTALELLFVPEDCILYEHPIFRELRMMRDFFISKDTVKVLYKYAMSQIRKARGLNKKIVNVVEERKTPLDFCFTFNQKQGTMPMSEWLEERGLKQKYCGLNHLPNMNRFYGCFYDWQEHMHIDWSSGEEMWEEYKSGEGQQKFFKWCFDNIVTKLQYRNPDTGTWTKNGFLCMYKAAIPKGYHGIQREDGKSTEIRLDSIANGDLPICHFSYNDDGFQSHCRQYREYQEWKSKRNQARYEGNLGHNYDAKNMCHTVRLLTMAHEIADGKGLILDRRVAGDRDYLLAIKNHKFEYEEVLSLANRLEEEIENSIVTCTLKDNVSFDIVDALLVNMRRRIYVEKLFNKNIDFIHGKPNC